MKNIKTLLNGIIKENPTFVMLIGMCPTIAITTEFLNAYGMGLSVLFVLIFSNLIISLLRNIVPNDIRIPVFIVVIATLVTIVELFLKAFTYELYSNIKTFVPLIVVNCIILGRAEAYASKNPPIPSIFDAIGMGLGFTISMILITAVRIFLVKVCNIEMFNQPVGGFLVLGLLIGIIQSIRICFEKKKSLKTKTNLIEEGEKAC